MKEITSVRRVAVCSAGSWGTAFAALAADAGSEVALLARRPEVAESITRDHRNPSYFPDLQLDPSITATTDPDHALSTADIVVLATSAQYLRDQLEQWGKHIPSTAIVVSLMKGIELGTTLRMTEVIHQLTGHPEHLLAVISGPNLAAEIVARQPAATVVASTDEHTSNVVAEACATPYFRPYTSTDVIGAELAGATKNVVALASGMAEGMGMGDNTKATIITRGLAESVRLGVALGATASTFSGLAGVGDLIATCMSPLSRNRTAGHLIGTGLTTADAVAHIGQTCEGIKSCEPILELARRHGVDVPIVESVVAVVHDGQPPMLMAEALMMRERRPEKLP